MKHFRSIRATPAIAAALAGLALAPAAAAQAVPDPELARIEAETKLEEAKAERDKAAAERIKALGLPSVEGKTALGTGAGEMEATILSTDALRVAAGAISAKLGTESYIVLAGDEALDLGRAGAVRTEVDAIRAIFLNAGVSAPTGPRSAVGASAVVAAISAAAGLLRPDTEVTALNLQAISHRALATAVAARLGIKAILPAAAIGALPPEDPFGPEAWEDKSLLQAFNSLGLYRDAAMKKWPANPAKPTDEQKRVMAAVARYDSFFARMTAADDKGSVPIAAAVRLSHMMRNKPKVLRLHVDKAGGSLINSKNLFTMLGVDPVKVSGGLVASYMVTDPEDGSVRGGDILTCRTSISGLRAIQEGRWRKRINQPDVKAVCDSALADQPAGT